MGLAPVITQRFGMSAFVAIYAVAALLWLRLASQTTKLLPAIFIGVALRLLVIAPEPLLSGDVYRYLSDGRMLASGVNPYTYTPTDPRINHPEIRSIYPPHAQLLFAVVHQLPLWRLLIIAFDVLALFLLRDRAFAYATCPLVIFEGTWSGHLDAIAAVFLLIALTRRSGAALAFAGGLKVIPLAALPVLARNARWKNALAFIATLALPVLPFLGKPLMPGFREYATRWIFNAPAYEVVRAIVAHIPTKTIWTHHPLRFQWLSDFVYQHLYDDFITRAILATIAIGGILLARRVTTAVAVLLLCSPAIHPWYWLTLVPSALVERSRWLYVALCAPASYLIYGHAHPMLVYAICYCVPALACVVSRSSSSPSRFST
ncbi:MAG TPA: hypothetical protein VF608_14285 [Thermoanaerobaculia bacterium]